MPQEYKSIKVEKTVYASLKDMKGDLETEASGVIDAPVNISFSDVIRRLINTESDT